jgi:GLPGLI family protein
MKSLQTLFIISLVLLPSLHGEQLFGQDKLEGIVKYQKVKKYNFKKKGDPRWDNYVAGLPDQTSFAYILSFDEESALYSDNPTEQEEIPKGLQRAMYHQNASRPPRPELVKVYYDLEKGTTVNQMEFMTRSFLVESETENPAWKLTNEQKKIMDYVCMSAELSTGKQNVKAWFTPQIPVPIGPDKFHGLPGLILAVERNGETFLLASNIDLSAPAEGVIAEPKEGKKVTQEEFKKIMTDKMEEFKKANPKGAKGRGKQGYHKR